MLLASFRASDVIGRLGGDEFVVLAGGPVEEARAGLARLRAATADFNAGRQRGYLISFAVGEATSAACRETVDELTNRADEAMYKAKRSRGPCDVLVSSH